MRGLPQDVPTYSIPNGWAWTIAASQWFRWISCTLLPTGSTTLLEHGALTNFGFAILSVIDRDGSHLELSAPL